MKKVVLTFLLPILLLVGCAPAFSLEEGVNTLATENGTQVISVDAQDDSAKQSNDVVI